MEKNKKVVIICIVIISIILLYGFYQNVDKIEKVIENIRIMEYGQPIDLETGTINNKFFEIYSDFSNSRKTTEGINKAIKYASENNIEYIKLESGNYTIMPNKSENGKKGIILHSNITLDLNGSSIKAEANNATNYTIITISDVENVKLVNGKLIGDRENHVYEGQSTHEWGMGITIKSGRNIELKNLHIYKMTGDGIYISKNTENINSSNIEISNCNIYDCRRQGITIISVNGVQIKENEIHDIYGTNPQAAIDLEANLQEEKIENVEIYNNNMYNFGNIYAIKVQKNVYTADINNNKINNSILVYDAKEKIQINNNSIYNGNVILHNSLNFRKQGRFIEKAIIEENDIYYGDVQVNRVNNLKVKRNYIRNGKVTIVSTNTILEDNSVINEDKNQEYAYKIEALNYKDIFYIYKNNNRCAGNIIENEIIEENDFLKITTDISKINVD